MFLIMPDEEYNASPLTESERQALATDIANKISLQSILDKVRDSVSQPKLDRIRLVTKKDLYNIEHSYNLCSSSVHYGDDGTSVEAWMNETNASDNPCVLFYKPQGTINEKHSGLKKDDFILIIMNSSRREILKKYGNDVICIDGKHRVNSYGFELITPLILYDMRQEFTCSFLISNRSDQQSNIVNEKLKSRRISAKKGPSKIDPAHCYEMKLQTSVMSRLLEMKYELVIVLPEKPNAPRTLTGEEFGDTRYYGLGLWLPEIFNRFEDYYKLHPSETVSVCELQQISSNINETIKYFPEIQNLTFENFDIKMNSSIAIQSSLTSKETSNQTVISTVATDGAICDGDEVNTRVFFNTLIIGAACLVGNILSGLLAGRVGVRVMPGCAESNRAMAVCTSILAGRVGAMTSNIVFGELIDVDCSVPIFLMGTVCIVKDLDQKEEPGRKGLPDEIIGKDKLRKTYGKISFRSHRDICLITQGKPWENLGQDEFSWKCWIHAQGQQGEDKTNAQSIRDETGSSGEEVASPIVLVSGFALAAPEEEATSLTIAMHVNESKI
ncbi:hypothetical protein ANN_08678 [Periplaneta americana]|uniref:Uncharacterized protein n=1 Tax=Periplaneta americana TaxID=6978 RepID=A0ABQ8T3R0_PERAM|nr:hypothetical protein ANN_08678 [Periplaneta americana]